MTVKLCKMTKKLAHQYYRKFEMDPILFTEPSNCKPYIYSEEQVDAYFDKQIRLGRVYLAILVESVPVGEIILKNMDLTNHCCTLSIHLQNDSVKGKGYGTQAEILALEYAFQELDMETVFADAVLQNQRSQHVLEKVGFVKTNSDDAFCYYRCDRSIWEKPE